MIKAQNKRIDKRIGLLENKKPTVVNDEFIMMPAIVHLSISEERQKEFYEKLRTLMVEYKIIKVDASLIKKF